MFDDIVKIVEKMIEHQERLNTKIAGPDWKEKNFPWWRAIWMEAAELMDCFPWKWWANTDKEPDLNNAYIELVDIWHFLLSWCIEDLITAEDIASVFQDNQMPSRDTLGEIESFFLIPDPALLVVHFARIARSIGLSLHLLAKLYFAKNALNQFRQEQGYKTGSYNKEHNGLEDNTILLEIVNKIPFDPDNIEGFMDYVKLKLREKLCQKDPSEVSFYRDLSEVPVYKDRSALRNEIHKILLENEQIFQTYGPHSEHSDLLLTDAYKAWIRYVHTKIIPNNRKIVQLLSKNSHLLTEEEMEIFEKFKLHQEGFEYNHVSGDKNSSAPLFPREIWDILKD